MRIYQIVPTLVCGDAVGNDTLAIKHLIEDMGFETDIFAENIAQVLYGKEAHHINEMPVLNKDDIIIYHLAIGSELNYKICKLKCRIIVIYHNITPPSFFANYNQIAYIATKAGLDGMRYLSDKVEYCFADSEFNKQDLIKAGYKCPIDVLPILIPFEDYEQAPSKAVLNKYADSRTNLLFTGRIAPNKKVENVIRTFYMYKKYYDKTARLFLVGSYNEGELYYRELRKYVDELKLDDVIFTGHIKFDEILAYYNLADTYICMSEHEGFCVPLVEAMYFKIPIVAYDKCAIKYTLGGSGFLLDGNDPLITAGVVHKINTDSDLRTALISGQKERLKHFGYEAVSEQFKKCLNRFIGGNKHEKENSIY